MKLISHRGLMQGPNAQLENDPKQIQSVLGQGIDVEVDVWYLHHQWYLGHDAATHNIGFEFLKQDGLWIHAKNFEAADRLIQLSRFGHSHNFFWHEEDERTLTSFGFWWTYPERALGTNSVAVVPERYLPLNEFDQIRNWNCFGVCTDWVSLLK